MKKDKSDKLKNFIDKNKESFHDAKAPSFIWENIERDLMIKATPRNQWPIIGGLVIVLIAIGAMLGYYFGNHQEAPVEEMPFLEQEILEFADIQDFNETQQYYIMQVNQVWGEIKNLHYDATLEADLSLLDSADKELRAELNNAEGSYKENVLQAMIQNQQTKLNLLMNVLKELKYSDQQQTQYETI